MNSITADFDSIKCMNNRESRESLERHETLKCNEMNAID